MIRWLLNKTMGYVLYQPKLASLCVKILTRFPLINDKLISFASNEGLITNSHAPVDKKGRKAKKNVFGNKLVLGFEDDHLNDSLNFEQNTRLALKPEGKNHSAKSPLEKWFY